MPVKSIFDGTKWDSQFFTASDALDRYQPTKYIIQDLLPTASLTVVYGAPGSNKTNWIIDACVCSALQKPFLKSESFAGFDVAEKNSVLWIDVDNGPSLMHERIGASLRQHAKNIEHAKSAPIHYASFLDPPFVATDDAAVNELIHRVQKFNAQLLVFDNLGTISGGVDENSSQMIVVTSRLRLIAARTNVAIVAIHHSAKSGDKNRQQSSRGHSSIDASADNALQITADENTIVIQQTKARRHRLPTFGAEFIYEHRPKTKDLLRMHFTGIEPQLPSVYNKAMKLLSVYLAQHKTGNQTTLTDLLSENKIPYHKARGIIQTLTKSNWLQVQSGTQKNSILYKLGDSKAKVSLL